LSKEEKVCMLKKPVSVAIALFASFGAIANAADLSASY